MLPVIVLAATEPTLLDAGFMFLTFIAAIGLMTLVMRGLDQVATYLRRGHYTVRTRHED